MSHDARPGYTQPVLKFGVVALGVSDVHRAAQFWSAALGYTLREDGFGGWAKVLVPPAEAGIPIALQFSQNPSWLRLRSVTSVSGGLGGRYVSWP